MGGRRHGNVCLAFYACSLPGRRRGCYRDPERPRRRRGDGMAGKASPKRVMFVGHSGAGKDTACRLLAELTHLRFAGTTSDFLAKYVAARLGVGNEIRRRDPGLLVRESLGHAEITAGAR